MIDRTAVISVPAVYFNDTTSPQLGLFDSMATVVDDFAAIFLAKSC